MSYSTIRTAIKTRMDAISGLGPGYTYERYPSDINPESDTFATQFQESGALNLYWIDRRSFNDKQPQADDNRRLRRHDVQVKVFQKLVDSATLADASGPAFQDLLETIANNIATGDRTWGSAALTTSLPRVSAISLTRFMGVLCHTATLEFTIEEVLS